MMDHKDNPERDVFPIIVRHSLNGQADDTLDDLFDMASSLEFYDDFDPTHLYFTANDCSNLRVIVHAVDVLLCRRVPQTFTLADLKVVTCRSANNGRIGHAELCGTDIHRVLYEDGFREPIDPFGQPSPVQLKHSDELSIRAFHEAWIAAQPAID